MIVTDRFKHEILPAALSLTQIAPSMHRCANLSVFQNQKRQETALVISIDDVNSVKCRHPAPAEHAPVNAFSVSLMHSVFLSNR